MLEIFFSLPRWEWCTHLWHLHIPVSLLNTNPDNRTRDKNSIPGDEMLQKDPEHLLQHQITDEDVSILVWVTVGPFEELVSSVMKRKLGWSGPVCDLPWRYYKGTINATRKQDSQNKTKLWMGIPRGSGGWNRGRSKMSLHHFKLWNI